MENKIYVSDYWHPGKCRGQGAGARGGGLEKASAGMPGFDQIL